jgi:hypothetical protein
MSERYEPHNLPFFDGAELSLFYYDDPMSSEGRTALNNFLTLGPDHRLACSHHVFSYYLDQKQFFEKEGVLIETMPQISSVGDVWRHVQPSLIWVEHDPCSDAHEPYVCIEGECDWEPEHGLMLCFIWGKNLAKCGPWDGHVTNRNAWAEDGVDGIVYRARDPSFKTVQVP